MVHGRNSLPIYVLPLLISKYDYRTTALDLLHNWVQDRKKFISWAVRNTAEPNLLFINTVTKTNLGGVLDALVKQRKYTVTLFIIRKDIFLDLRKQFQRNLALLERHFLVLFSLVSKVKDIKIKKNSNLFSSTLLSSLSCSYFFPSLRLEVHMFDLVQSNDKVFINLVTYSYIWCKYSLNSLYKH